MATVRTVLAEALRAVRAIAPGDDPKVDELAAGLEAAQALVLELHEARGPMIDVDVTADYTAGENQRVRVQAGFNVNVTLPNAVRFAGYIDPYDYGFSVVPTLIPPQGTTGAADGVQYRQPRDGARVEVVGVTAGLWFYRADINAWTAAFALTVDSELPINARLTYPFAALLAERLAPIYLAQLTPVLATRVAHARATLFGRTGTARDPVMAEYF